MKELYVFHQNRVVGTLTEKADATLAFSYDETWKNFKDNYSISPVLQVSHEGPFDNRMTRSYFENLLPEGKIRAQVEKIIGKSLEGEYQFLEEFGEDCAGALIVTPNPEYPKIKIENDFEKLNINELVKVHENNQDLMSHIIQKHKGKFSLAGAQDKVPLVYHNGEVYVPTKGVATTHILKPPHINKNLKDTVYNEYFMMKLARAVGLRVPTVDILEAKIPFFIVERFDRELAGESIERLHQIDFCQAQGFLSSEKYESDGGPGLLQDYSCIRENSSNSIDDVDQFMKWLSFNILIGNNDTHSKNISFLRNGKAHVLAPFYDLLCTSIYKEYSADFAFKIGENRNWGQWSIEHFQNEAIKWGLSKNPDTLLNTFLKMKVEMLSQIDGEVATFKERFKGVKTANRIKDEIEKRVASFEKRLKSI